MGFMSGPRSGCAVTASEVCRAHNPARGKHIYLHIPPSIDIYSIIWYIVRVDVVSHRHVVYLFFRTCAGVRWSTAKLGLGYAAA